MKRDPMKSKDLLDSIATGLLAIAACTAIWYMVSERYSRRDDARSPTPKEKKTAAAPQLPKSPISIEDTPLDGKGNAPVVIVEYSDFQCPFCRSFALETLPELRRQYIDPGLVALAFRQLPIEKVHAAAFKAAEASECAARQGKFWEMHGLLFERQSELGTLNFAESANSIRLDVQKFNLCLQGQAVEKVRGDIAAAREFAISGTPAFLFGVRQADGKLQVKSGFSGAKPFAEFKTALERLVATAPSPLH